jgi:AcrR family transcriptional regulator
MATIPTLRERKKQQQREHIQRCALKLFLQNGYNQTSVEHIARTADIATATYFNYFSTKEAVIFDILFDPSLVISIRQQPTTMPFIASLSTSLRAMLTSLQGDVVRSKEDCFTLINKTPELRDGLVRIMGVNGIDLLASLISQRADRKHTDVSVRILAGAIIGVAIATLLEPQEDCTAIHCIERFCDALDALGTQLQQI